MLSVLIVLPLIAALCVAYLPERWSRPVALAALGLVSLWTVVLLVYFDPAQTGMQFAESYAWIPQIGLDYRLGVDGISLPLVALSSLLTAIAIFSTDYNGERPRLYYSLLLLINAGLAGGFLAQNLLLFFFFYEVQLIPFYLLIAIWGGTDGRAYAAMKFLLFTAISGFLVLGAFLGIAISSATLSFNYDPSVTQGLPLNTQIVLISLLLAGFAIKIPLVPLHTWLPDAYVEASPPVAMLLGGVMAKLGAYGLLRFALGLFPEAWSVVAPGLAWLGAITAVYGALIALAQRDIKRMVAYSSIGHMGYLLLGMAAATQISLLGVVLQMVSHGLILALLFHIIGVIETKVGTRDLDLLNGLMNPVRGLPLMSGLLVLGGMASAGIPGMVGFISEYLILQGSYSQFPVPTLLCIVCSGLTAVYFVVLLNQTCFGRLSQQAYYPKVQNAERAPALILLGLVLVLGIQPHWLTYWTEPTTTALTATPWAKSALSLK